MRTEQEREDRVGEGGLDRKRTGQEREDWEGKRRLDRRGRTE